MKKHLSFVLIIGVLAAIAAPARGAVTASKKLSDGTQFTVDGGTLRVQFWSPEIVRVTFANAAELPTNKSLSVVASPATVRLTRQENGQAFTLAAPRVKVKIDKQTGAVSFLDAADHVLLREAARWPQDRSRRRSRAPRSLPARNLSTRRRMKAFTASASISSGAWNYSQRRQRQARAGQHGRGRSGDHVQQRLHAALGQSRRDHDFSRAPRAMQMPAQKCCAGRRNAGKAIDYYFCYGDGTIDAAMKAYRHLTGDAPLMPEWELGFWQCKERYASQEELLGVAKKLRDLKVPVDGIIQDWQYWPPGTNTWGSHLFDPARYPDPVGMFKELHEMHYHALISVWAKFDLGSDNSKELNAVGGMFPQVTRYVFPPGQGQWYDPFATAGRQTYWKQMRDQLFAKGVDGWWLDAPEPEIGGMALPHLQNSRLGPGYDGLQRLSADALHGHLPGPAGRHRSKARRHPHPFGLRRPAAQQRHHLVGRHSGNLAGSSKIKFRPDSISRCPASRIGTPTRAVSSATAQRATAIPAIRSIRNFSPAGSSSAPSAPCSACMVPTALSPGKEFWRFDDKTQGILRNYLDLRYRLLPYLYSAAWQVTSEGSTFMRPLVMDFPKDPQALDIGDQYLFGPAIMVTPVTTAGATNRSVYLPAGQRAVVQLLDRRDFPRRPDASRPRPPSKPCRCSSSPARLFPWGRSFSIPARNRPTPLNCASIAVRMAKFTLYEDEGDTYDYEKGKYATIPISWNDAKHTLEIGKRSGEFPGMLKERTFNVVFVSPGHGAGIPVTDKPDAVIHYNGKAVVVKVP